MDFYLGRINAAQLFRSASSDDAKKATAQACEANFFLGESELLEQNLDEARMLLEAAARDCPRGFYEHHGAVSELKALAR
jgi:lipoprotein NlpI